MRIRKLTLFSSDLQAQKAFYQEQLGLKLIHEEDVAVEFRIGSSIIRFEQKANAEPYHFAINIPANQEKEAVNWLKSRLQILSFQENEIQDFEDWNAKAIYFYDADQNIVEFIARNNLDNTSNVSFAADSLLEISEIGLPTNSIEGFHHELSKITPMPIYDGNYDRFCAIGDERGLFITIDPSQKKWFPTNDPAYLADFDLSYQLKKKEYKLSVRAGMIA